MLRLLMVVACLLCVPALAGEIGEVDTKLASEAKKYSGFEHRSTVHEALALAGQGDSAAAWTALEPVLAHCEQEWSVPGRLLVSVLNVSEEAEVRSSTSQNVYLSFVDIACPSASKTAAFLAVREKNPERALKHLDRAQALAPFWAEPLAERAYLIGSLGDRPSALTAYRAALRLAEKYSGSAYMKPLILRGIGFSLTELGDLDGAQRAYEDSLKLDPSNELAKKELLYIQQLRAQQKHV